MACKFAIWDNGKENGNYYGESNGKENEHEMETGIIMVDAILRQAAGCVWIATWYLDSMDS